jgi:hypothetical protein
LYINAASKNDKKEQKQRAIGNLWIRIHEKSGLTLRLWFLGYIEQMTQSHRASKDT